MGSWVTTSGTFTAFDRGQLLGGQRRGDILALGVGIRECIEVALAVGASPSLMS